MQENTIIKFIEDGGDLLSKEGQKLVADSDVAVIKEAFTNPNHHQIAQSFMDNMTDPFTRRKVFMAFGG